MSAVTSTASSVGNGVQAAQDERQHTVLILMVMWMVREGGIALRLATEYAACRRISALAWSSLCRLRHLSCQ
jgi:hypothetical protein